MDIFNWLFRVRYFIPSCLLFALFTTSGIANASSLILNPISAGNVGATVIDGAAVPGAINSDRTLFLEFSSGRMTVFDKSEGTSIEVLSSLGQNNGNAYSVAFAPNFEMTGHLYVSSVVIDTGKVQNIVTRFTLDTQTLVVQPNTEYRIATINNPSNVTFGHHTGGAIAFDSNGYLYLTTGDARNGTGQIDTIKDLHNPSNSLGSLYRIDPTGDDFTSDAQNNFSIPADNPSLTDFGPPGVVARGLRNPFKAAFDPVTGNLFIGDVGENTREEINVYTFDESNGVNFQWPRLEGSEDFDSSISLSGISTGPLYEYNHGAGLLEGFSVTGGLVYRGPTSELDGQYIFGDFGNFPLTSPYLKRFFSFDATLSTVTVDDILVWNLLFPSESEEIGRILGFVQDTAGNLYASDFSGNVFSVAVAVVPAPPAAILFSLTGVMLLLGRIRRPRKKRVCDK